MDPNYKNMNKQELLSVLSQLLKEKEHRTAPEPEPERPKPNVEEIIEEVKKKLSTEN